MSGSTVGVCGFGRCGSSMVMAMLAAGGLPPVEGSQALSFELPNLAAIARLTPAQLSGRAVKLLDEVMRRVPPAADWRFVWLDRDPVQQARSMVKLVAGVGVELPGDAVDRLVASHAQDRPALLGGLRRLGPVTILRYERVLANPGRAARRLRLVFEGIDVKAAAAVVHDRDGTCRPDLAFEMGDAS